MKKVLFLACAILAACDSKPPTPPPAPNNNTTTPPPANVDTKPPAQQETPKGSGVISGKATLNAAAKRKKVKTDADPVCQDQYRDNAMLSDDAVTKDIGGEQRLQYVMVYLSNASGSYPSPKDEVLLDQKGCRYEPHVVGVMVNQPIKIRNSDPTMHNIHAMPNVNKEFNFGQAKAGMEEIKSFDQPEKALKIKCDVHPWMLAWAFVFNHPFYAVTKDDGTFEIKNVPAGTYELVFWHEKFDEQKFTIKVEADKTVTQNATFEQK
jgi:hypothetical protein